MALRSSRVPSLYVTTIIKITVMMMNMITTTMMMMIIIIIIIICDGMYNQKLK